jgi:hypothetical protein
MIPKNLYDPDDGNNIAGGNLCHCGAGLDNRNVAEASFVICLAGATEMHALYNRAERPHLRTLARKKTIYISIINKCIVPLDLARTQICCNK